MRKKHRTAVWQRWIKQHKIRVLLCAVLVTALYLTPMLTQAQYKWTLNGYSTIQAKEYYFSSNILKDENLHMRYPMGGWNGMTRDLPEIWIANYDNALLANKKDEDTRYTISWSIVTNRKNSSGADYTLKLTDHTFVDGNNENTLYSNGNGAQSVIKGNGEPKKDIYKLEIVAPEDEAQQLTAGESVTVYLTAVAGTKNTYSKTLTATYTYTVSSVDDYVTQFDMQETENSGDTVLKMGTGVKPLGASSQTVVVWWDPEKLKINTFNYVFLETNRQGGYKVVEKDGKNYGTLRLTGLGDSSYRELEFEKVGNNNTDIWFTNGQNIGKNIDYRNGNSTAYIGFYVEVEGTE